jgi:hypothetical protein
MPEDDNTADAADLLAAMEKHVAFLQGALNIEMTPVFKEDDVILSQIEGMDHPVACRLVFPSRTSASGWMDDSILFENLKDMVAFLDNVELLFRIARAQQRGD